MASTRVPAALAEHLGDEATEALHQFMETARVDWSEDVLSTAAERFGSRLATEIASLRVDFGRDLSMVRQDMTRDMATLRQDMTTDMAMLRQEMRTDTAALHREMTAGMTNLRQDMTEGLAGLRVEVLKWSFLFWIGQVAAIAGLLAFMQQA
jgi:hypothetical protein